MASVFKQDEGVVIANLDADKYTSLAEKYALWILCSSDFYRLLSLFLNVILWSFPEWTQMEDLLNLTH